MTLLLLDFTLRQGDFVLEVHERIDARAVALVGSSGAGKTSTLEAIAGLRRPARGEIRLGDHVLFDSTRGIDLPPRHRRIGFVPQDVALFPHMGVRRNVLYGARGGARTRIGRISALFEITALLDRRVEGLSGGERQRVALARALMAAPDLLLFDEPLAALDVAARQRILPYLARVREELAIPLVYVSHNEAEVRALADWVIVLERGRVTRSARPDEMPAWS